MKRREACLLIAAAPAVAANFSSNWSATSEQAWLGPEYWANRLQDWRLRKGRIECTFAGGDRNVFLLTHELSDRAEAFETRVQLGRLDEERGGQGFSGFRIGMRGPFHDHRDTAIYGIGLDAGLSADGRLFIGNLDHASDVALPDVMRQQLVLAAQPKGTSFDIVLTALDAAGKEIGKVTRTGIPADWVAGGMALVCSSGPVHNTPDPSQNVITLSGINRKGRENEGRMRFWFSDWKVAGSKVDTHPDRAWGPILFAMHTLSRNVLKLTAQLAPVNITGQIVRLQIRNSPTAAWRTAGESRIDPLARTATFRIPKWDDTREAAYRVVYRADKEYTYEGTIQRDPRDKDKLMAGALSCMNDLGFPHTDITRNLLHFKPDVLFFVGDQIYERSASYGIERMPVERASLDYLRKWYLFGWGFRDLLRDTPAVCLPDDHDVYHGNVWGAGGRHAEGFGQAGQDSGGYVEPAAWVNMVQRTQTSHLPDPFDPKPVEQDIGVYYTEMRYGGVSFAILEDRKWKSSPKTAMPEAKVINGWAQNPAYLASRDGDVARAELLGKRQIDFLKHWASDWNGGVRMKAVVSQTLFANVATLPPPANDDSVTGKLPILAPDSYSEGELKVADHDSNSWPQTPRHQALRAIRRALAVHIAGDQHLGSTIQYGIDEWNDGPWALCVPAVSNLFPRRWYPAEPGRNRKPGAPRNTGEYLDGFGNKVTVHSIFNPSTVNVEPRVVNQRAPGYGIVVFDQSTHEVTLTNWPRWVDASLAGAKPCPGWPIVVKQAENGLPNSDLRLDTVQSHGDKGLLIEVRDDEANEHLYTYRMLEPLFTPRVWKLGVYSVTVKDASGKVLDERKHQVPKS
ncbi:MAG TPA: alkaline phosphatase D family protein [Bryobacteraceae bacterium]|nr:alkaline phosphatase D family protein [Bryobacteraceae bacterium]